MQSFTIYAKVPFEKSINVFSSRRILDSIHGMGLWKFTDWKSSDPTTSTRKGKIRGVKVPSFARFLNGGKKYISCLVTQSYTILDTSIVVKSTLEPKVAGTKFAKNETTFKIVQFDSRSCMVYIHSRNTTDLPHPLHQLAIETMDEMTNETIKFLEEALTYENLE